jgi:hypothetical protein
VHEAVKASLLPQFTRKDWLRPSILALIAANLFPLLGVFLFHWEVFPLLLLFWCENVIIGFFNAVKMLIAGPGEATQWATKFFLVPFFCFHYGMFTFVHGIFILEIFGGKTRLSESFPGPHTFIEAVRTNQLTWAILGLFASHAISFAHNFIIGGEFRRARTDALMGQPYGRIFILHFTILLGGFLMMALHSPAVGLALLVTLKILLDLRGHLKEREKFASSPKTSSVTAQP